MHSTCFVLIIIFNYVANYELDTKIGKVIGLRSDYGSEFLGVPYAKVDVGNPFGNSLPHPYFKEPFNASNPSTRCPQAGRIIGGTIQCLTLNIYVPNNADVNHTVPVLVWFHGGGFRIGSAGDYGGKNLTQHGIIVVTANYRLGPYGFLCLDEEIPGNQGLKDQISALKWVQANIRGFGGDENSVTIGGQSYGGGAVDLHLYSKLSNKLFDKVIIQSGSMYAEGAFVKSDVDAANKLAQHLECFTNNTKDALKCLATKDSITVVKAANEIGLKLGACKEKQIEEENFTTQDPFHVDLGQDENVAVLIGYNSNENFAAFANKSIEFYETLGNVFRQKFEKNFVLEEKDLEHLSKLAQEFYLGNSTLTPIELQKSYVQLSEFTSDFMLNYAMEWSVQNYLRKGLNNVYKYVFSYTGGSPFKNLAGVGAYHTEELQYLFEMESKSLNEEQQLISNRMTKMWTNFVKFGNPTPNQTDLVPITWLPVTEEQRSYLNIDLEMKMLDNANGSRMKFWADIWTSYWKNSVILL